METRQQRFRSLMGRFATGVTVVAAKYGGEVTAMTANAFTAVSLDPLLLLVCVRNESRMLPRLLEAGCFSVNVLSSAQAATSRFYGGRAQGECPARWCHDQAAAPVLEGAIATFVCRVDSSHRVGDHTVLYGAVDDMLATEPAHQALVYAGGTYHDLALAT